MNSVVCTLFEGNYHYGVAALINSLYEHGFRGDVFAGYRGELPKWAKQAIPNPALDWAGGSTLTVNQEVYIHFMPLTTTYHLTNYKPDFMLALLEGPGKNTDGIFYFDPDITANTIWANFEDWIDCGIALCEDVNSPLSEYHPRRMGWRNYFKDFNIYLNFKNSIYVNGGFIGISKKDMNFLVVWREIQEIMAHKIGGLSRSSLSGLLLTEDNQGPFAPFSRTDQDALNATIEAWGNSISFLGKEGMSFKAGASILPHALGQPKPWNRKPLVQIFNGLPPRVVDREYWKFANGIIITRPFYFVSLQKFSIIIAAFIGRFYRRGGL